MKQKHILWGLFSIFVLLSLHISVYYKNTFYASLLFISGLLFASFANLERKKNRPEKAVLIALLSSVSVVGRIIFSGIPSVQVSSFMIIISGISFGSEIGLFTGIITALCSNLVLGQGPWTIWQMFLWGCMGLISGFFGKTLVKSRVLIAVYGIIWGFLFGWGMNLWFVFGYSRGFSAAAFAVAGMSSFPMDLAHALSNAVLLILAVDSMIGKLKRIGIKYGIL